MRTLALTLVITLGCAGARHSRGETAASFDFNGVSVERVAVNANLVTVALGARVLAFEHLSDGRYFTNELPYRTFDSWQDAARAVIDQSLIVPETAAR